MVKSGVLYLSIKNKVVFKDNIYRQSLYFTIFKIFFLFIFMPKTLLE